MGEVSTLTGPRLSAGAIRAPSSSTSVRLLPRLRILRKLAPASPERAKPPRWAVCVPKNCGKASSCSATVAPGSKLAKSAGVSAVTGVGVAMPSVWRRREPVTVISSSGVVCSAALWASTVEFNARDEHAEANGPGKRLPAVHAVASFHFPLLGNSKCGSTFPVAHAAARDSAGHFRHRELDPPFGGCEDPSHRLSYSALVMSR